MYKRTVGNILEQADTLQKQGTRWQFCKVNNLIGHI